MTEISFHFNVADKLDYACRLLRKAVNSGSRVVVRAEPDLLAQLDTALWTFSALHFVPHCMAGAEERVLSASPVILGGPADSVVRPETQVMLNIGAGIAQGFERFQRLIEIASTQEADRLAARTRWRHYAQRGYEIVRYDANPTLAP